ncbi:ankyrin repeat-containing domain protein, partial [Lactarius sanguifluus]
WLSPPDPSTNQNIASTIQHEGTATWFFRGSIFMEWKSKATTSLLWVHGKPGSGKSILWFVIIYRLRNHPEHYGAWEAGLVSIAYFYFDFKDTDKQNLNNLLPSLLTQLSTRSDSCCDVLSRIYMAHDDGARKPNTNTLITCLKKMLALPGQVPIYIILDALYECPNTSGIPPARIQVLDLIMDLVDLQLPNLHICITSRPENDIRSALELLAFYPVSIHEQSGQKKDIEDYIRSVVYAGSDTAMRRWRDKDKELVIETLTDKADGMFRWVFCQLEVLQHCFPQSIRRTLNELPKSLDETYERVLKEIGMANRDHAHRLLQCLTAAARPLRVEELAEILALDFDGAEGAIPKLKEDWRWEDRQRSVLSTCSSLITQVEDGDSQVIQFSHFSVKEFLTSDRLATSKGDASYFHIIPEHAHTTLAQACLGTLLQLDGIADDNPVEDRFPLAGYASWHWVEHAQFGKVSSRIEDGMRRLFDSTKPHFAAWVQLHNIDDLWFNFGDPPKDRGSPLYYASLCGFRDLAAHIILLHRHGAAVDVTDDFYNLTPLYAASRNGSIDVTRWLLDHDADPNWQRDHHWTPIHEAAEEGHLEVVRLLLDRGANAEAKKKDGMTPLHLASSQGNTETVRLLLDHGTNAHAEDNDGWTPLHHASSIGSTETVRLLLDRGASADAKDKEGRTPFQVASERGKNAVVQMLTEH